MGASRHQQKVIGELGLEGVQGLLYSTVIASFTFLSTLSLSLCQSYEQQFSDSQASYRTELD